MSQPEYTPLDADYVLTLEEIGNLAAEGSKPAETLMNEQKITMVSMSAATGI